ncbi:hypothetical protein DL96DRAFT_1549645 [Flagelloscypha sp. PMI_526]|nr:hypothetical protein DL96DRAFT_1549645 [Flagelloscypha sp. PMI_526]
MLSLPRTILALSLAAFSGATLAGREARADPETDVNGIIGTIKSVNQAFTLPLNALPDQAIQKTVVTAADGKLTDAAPVVPLSTDGTAEGAALIPRGGSHGGQTTPTFKEVIKGNISAAGVPGLDCSIEGIAYLGYTLVPNITYSVDDCLSYCKAKQGCVEFNIYYEFNNPLLDWVFNEKSNLKCVLWGDFHGQNEKTNCGGQQQAPEGWGKTYIERSSVYALPALPEPAVPTGYWKIFGPINFAIRSPGYYGYSLLSQYDVAACSAQCDAKSGCFYFNLWRAVEDEKPKTYVCTLYGLNRGLISAAPATYEGQEGISVTWSRGYFKTSGLQNLLGALWQLFFGHH